MKNKGLSTLLFIILIIFSGNGCTSIRNEKINELTFSEEGRTEILFDEGWRFYIGENSGAEAVKFDDSKWRKLDLPHDWSIENLPGLSSPFNPDAVSQVSGGFTTGGTGWYRKTFFAPGRISSKRILVQFDGVYMNPEIWLNGVLLGNHPYGYTSFWFDITENVKTGMPNVLAVKVRNEGENSRWYSGSGIYRHVWIKVIEPVHICQWGTSITTPEAEKDSAKVKIRTKINNQSSGNLNIKLVTKLLNAKGEEINNIGSEHIIGKEGSYEFNQELTVTHPELWSTEAPALYTAKSEVYIADRSVDRTETKFGIRIIKFDVLNGFQLNGKSVKLKGGCFHHDNGPLGSKSYDRAEERRIELLKASGFNAIRCSHNPPSPALLDACDRLGMMVIDEAFDMWKEQKNPYDYHLYFNEWWQRDIESMVLRDRNHPALILWSIGNEIPNRHKPEVVVVAKMVGDYIRSIDSTHPITSAVNDLKPDKDQYFKTLDVAGYNYASGGDHNQKSLYAEDHKRLPERIMVGLESFPLEAFGAWMDVIDNPFVIGDFVWTAFDYIGEASIGWRGYPQTKNFFPWNLAYCGDIDICGWKRPQSFYRDVLWKDNQLSIFVKPPKPSFETNPDRASWSKWHWFDVVADWNWKGYEEKLMEVNVYSSCEEAELFLNNKSFGKKKTGRSTSFKTLWQVPYQAGVLKVAGYNGGIQVNTATLQTADEPTQVRLTADRSEIRADGQDLSYITVELTDDNGIRNPKAGNLVQFELEGAGSIAGVGNANPVSTESYTAHERKAWQGRCLVVIKSTYDRGKITLKASAGNLKAATVVISSDDNFSGTK